MPTAPDSSEEEAVSRPKPETTGCNRQSAIPSIDASKHAVKEKINPSGQENAAH